MAGMVVLGLGFVIAIFYFIRHKKRKDEISYYGADLDAEKSVSEKSIYLDGFGGNETNDEEDDPKIEIETEKKQMQVV